MDILCTRCGEPWDAMLDDLQQHEREDFRAGKGCPTCIDDPNPDNINPESSAIQEALQDVLGDDVDALAGMMGDFDLI